MFCFNAIIQGEIVDLVTLPALLELDPKSFRNLSRGRICNFYCCCVYYYCFSIALRELCSNHLPIFFLTVATFKLQTSEFF